MIGKIIHGTRRFLPLTATLLLATPAAHAHPMPDVPVRTAFLPGGEVRVTIELDARCLAEDPETAPYVTAAEFQSAWSADDRSALLESARRYLPTILDFEFEPGGRVAPDFEVLPTPRLVENGGGNGEDGGDEHGGGAESGEVLFLTATATFPLPPGATNYRLHALDHGYLTVMFFNEFAGKPVERFQALFPGETSYWLDLLRGDLTRNPPLAADAPRHTGTPWFLVLLTVLVLLAVGAWFARRSARHR